MNEVSRRACIPLVNAVRQSGRPVDGLLEGLPFALEDLHRPSQRVSWNDFLVLLERTVSLLGNADELAAAVQSFPKSLGVVSALASKLGSMRAVYTLGSKWYGQSLFLSTRAFTENLPDGRIRQTVEILPSYDDSELFFRAVRSFLSAAPQVLGMANAAVEMEIQPRRAIYTITLPRAPSALRRLRFAFSRGWSAEKATEELVAVNAELRESCRSERAAYDRLASKSRFLEALNRIGHSLAQHVDVHELASGVVELLEHEFHFRGAVFSMIPLEGGEPEVISSAGDISGAPSRSYRLTAGTSAAGRLDLWESAVEHRAEGDELLGGLLPWFALALNNARAFESLSRQTLRLEAEIAARKLAEEQIRGIQKVEALGKVAASLAHDFNNLLTAITTYAELAQRQIESGNLAAREIAGILGAANRGAGVIKQILAFTRRTPLKAQPLDLNALLRGMTKLLGQLVDERIELVILPARELGVVLADPTGLEEAIINLIVNSRDAMPEGGRITIRTFNEDDESHDAPELGYATLEVSDNGCGIDPKTRSRIFEPFFTTKPYGKGTGLGLAIVRETVTQSGGSVAVQSKPGEGARFTIRLPRVSESLRAASADEVEAEPAGGRETILLVEDEEEVRMGIRQVLEQKGYGVLGVSGAKDAVDLCHSHADAIDLLLTDVGLEELDGFKLAWRAASLRPDLRGVVYISGYAHDEVAKGGLVPIPQVFLPKPFTRLALLRTIRRVLDAK